MTPPLSGHDARILELLLAGRSFDDVCEIGRHRKTWRPSAVHRVVSTWLPARVPAPLRDDPPAKGKPRGRPPAPGERRGPLERPITHGTESGYNLHRRRGLPYCDECRQAHADYRRKRTA